MIKAIWIDGEAEGIWLCRRVRQAAGITLDQEMDAMSASVLVYDGDRPVATGRLRPGQSGWVLEGVTVLEGSRGKGLGDLVFRMLCARAIDTAKSAALTLTCPEPLEPVAARFGFRKKEGQDQMEVMPQDFDWNRPCGKK